VVFVAWLAEADRRNCRPTVRIHES
jgi:hypothetical protein